MLYSFFAIKKTIKNRQALHEIVRVSSFCINFVELSFKPVYTTVVVKNFKFMENYNSWKMFLQVKILTLDNFTHMLPLLPFPFIATAVTTLLQVLSSSLRWAWNGILCYLYFIWFVIFSKVITFFFSVIFIRIQCVLYLHPNLCQYQIQNVV